MQILSLLFFIEKMPLQKHTAFFSNELSLSMMFTPDSLVSFIYFRRNIGCSL